MGERYDVQNYRPSADYLSCVKFLVLASSALGRNIVMTDIRVEYENCTCQQVEDLAVIQPSDKDI